MKKPKRTKRTWTEPKSESRQPSKDKRIEWLSKQVEVLHEANGVLAQLTRAACDEGDRIEKNFNDLVRVIGSIGFSFQERTTQEGNRLCAFDIGNMARGFNSIHVPEPDVAMFDRLKAAMLKSAASALSDEPKTAVCCGGVRA